MGMNKKLTMAALSLVLLASTGSLMMTRHSSQPSVVKASDHDDGETDIKTKNTNMTDMYVMREADLTGGTFGTGNGQNPNLIMAMYVNPRSIARQQYFFNQTANYTFHIGDVGTDRTNLTKRGSETLRLKFNFAGSNAANGTQNASVQVVPVTTTFDPTSGLPTAVTEGTATTQVLGGGIQAEPPGTIGSATGVIGNINTSPFNLNGQACTFFAGLREDTFTFDVSQFFRVRAFALGKGPAPVGGVVFRPHVPVGGWANNGTNPSLNNAAIDFPKDFNVLAIVLRIPVQALQATQGGTDTVFDVQGTIEVPQ
jgi:hypothetical protein